MAKENESEQHQEVEDLGGGVLNPVIDVRLDKLPANAILAAAAALKQGMKYEKNVPDNWKRISPAEHYSHALRHMMLANDGDKSEPHVGHALSRVMLWASLMIDKGRE